MQNETERRLAQLERQLQQNRRMNRLLIAGILMLAFMGFRQNEALQHLSVKSLSVVNESGKVMARLGIAANGGQLQLFDSTGTLHTENGAGNLGGYLNLYNKKKQHTVWLTQMGDGGGYVGVKNPAGKDVAALGVSNGSAGFAAIRDIDGRDRITLALNNGSGFTEWYNRNGYSTVRLYATDNSRQGGFMGVYSFGGNLRNYMGIDENGHGVSWMYNNTGYSVIGLQAGSGLLLRNQYGKNRAWLSVAGRDFGYLNLYNRFDQTNIYLGTRAGLKEDGVLYTSDGFKNTGAFPQ